MNTSRLERRISICNKSLTAENFKSMYWNLKINYLKSLYTHKIYFKKKNLYIHSAREMRKKKDNDWEKGSNMYFKNTSITYFWYIYTLKILVKFRHSWYKYEYDKW